MHCKGQIGRAEGKTLILRNLTSWKCSKYSDKLSCHTVTISKKNLWKCSPFVYFVQLQYCEAILWWLYDVRTLKTLTLTQNLKWILPVWKVTVWQKMGKSGVENEKSWMWNVFYVLVAFITCFSILYRKFFTLRSHFKKPTSQCDIPKNAKISHSFV